MSLEPNDDRQRKIDSSAENRETSASQAAHRDQLLKKLNCLIAVLEAAIAKVRRSQQTEGTDPDRLESIRANLENTLTICIRAKVTLERRGTLPANLPPEVSEAVGAQPATPSNASATPGRRGGAGPNRMTYRDYVELSSVEEFNKFRGMPPISVEEIATCDIESLASKLGLS